MEFYLGFPEDCLKAKPAIVKDLDSESQAAEAGVREGDIVSPRTAFLCCREMGTEI
jgi:S1-C subfamily serine protease